MSCMNGIWCSKDATVAIIDDYYISFEPVLYLKMKKHLEKFTFKIIF
ncbi:MAG: hypothetical protein H9893_07210 [Candidatus Niameybacter stercoravium]|nr:hypothetical protein [Candidatus Niameybacter stercoravium]